MSIAEQAPTERLLPDVTDNKEKLRLLIEAGRDTLSDEQLDVLFTLYESDSLSQAAAELGKKESEVLSLLADIIAASVNPTPIEVKKPVARAPRPERVTKKGEAYKKRLGRTAYNQILLENDDFSDEERAVIQAIAKSSNQVIAAQSLGMSYKDFDRLHIAIRRKHEF